MAKYKAGWHIVGEKKCYFRSSYEIKYAQYLQALKKNKTIIDWEYEPKTFWFEKIKRGVRSFKPDFRVTDDSGHQFYIEVKGRMDTKSKTKIRRFKKYFPDERLDVVEKDWFKARGLT